MTADWVRPEPELIRSKWLELLSGPSISLNQLKRTAFQGNITLLRSVYWRIFLGQLPTPLPTLNSKFAPTGWTFALEKSRSHWEELRQKYLRAPDGLWLEDSVESSDQNLKFKLNQQHISTTPLLPLDSQFTDLGVNNPLSQHEDLRKTIKQDVIRTFPELEYFRKKRTQAMLTDILHVYCKLHQYIGYRQGMHEILGVLLETLDLDSLNCPSKGKPGLIHQVLSRDHLEHDAFSLFSLLMKPMNHWYDPNLSIPLGDLANNQTTPLTSVGFVPSQLATILPATNASFPHHPLVQPIVERCASIFHVYLKYADPELWAHLDKLEIEPQLWGIRWLRLLFTREFTYQESLVLWDGIFAQDGASLRLADFVCIAMLLRIREGLLDSDYSGALQLILRFPQPTDEDSRIALLLYQAILLYQFPTPDTALLIIRQNLDLQLFAASNTPEEPDSWFGISRQPSASSTVNNPQESLNRKPQFKSLQKASNALNNNKAIASTSSGQSSTSSMKPPSLTKSRSILGALVELRKSYSPALPMENCVESPTPMTAQLQSPWNSTASSNPALPKLNMNNLSVQSQDAQCLANQAVGQALGLCVDALEQNLFRFPGQPVDSSQGLALGALKHIRDIMLSGFSSGFDSNVMSPLIEYQSATTSIQHPTSTVLNHSASSSSFDTVDTVDSLNCSSYCHSRSATTDSPELSLNQSTSGGSSDSVQFSNLRSTVLVADLTSTRWVSRSQEDGSGVGRGSSGGEAGGEERRGSGSIENGDKVVGNRWCKSSPSRPPSLAPSF
ncbi:hypothetical protein VP01_2475g1 [Puccinia sorghi]|uniref:Rab-GAP TBC domain-containing protein n=1 Tax=Puccinia sorghi TaxID=27349 RepID=A0A0L6V6K4_9BASI|nr:hypothetical protein VP01_2475g1 [Puccinia sorghi]